MLQTVAIVFLRFFSNFLHEKKDLFSQSVQNPSLDQWEEVTFLVGTKRCSSIISEEAATAGDGRQKMKMGKKRNILSRTPGAGVASKNLSVGRTRNNSNFCSFIYTRKNTKNRTSISRTISIHRQFKTYTEWFPKKKRVQLMDSSELENKP